MKLIIRLKMVKLILLFKMKMMRLTMIKHCFVRLTKVLLPLLMTGLFLIMTTMSMFSTTQLLPTALYLMRKMNHILTLKRPSNLYQLCGWMGRESGVTLNIQLIRLLRITNMLKWKLSFKVNLMKRYWGLRFSDLSFQVVQSPTTILRKPFPLKSQKEVMKDFFCFHFILIQLQQTFPGILRERGFFHLMDLLEDLQQKDGTHMYVIVIL